MTHPRIGVVALARPTFDVPLAKDVIGTAWAQIAALPASLIGTSDLVLDGAAADAAVAGIADARVDLLLILQSTFTDADAVVKLAKAADAPLLLWSFPEERTGGRLRLNSLCGVNLAGHALGRAGVRYDYLHARADDPRAGEEILALARAAQIRARLAAARIGVVGQHPVGFDTCSYDAAALDRAFGVTVEPVALGALFDRARAVPAEATASLRASAGAAIAGMEDCDTVALDKSLATYDALKTLAVEQRYDALAVRCWPEFFTELGCAACGPMAMMNQDCVPCACEADVQGTIGTLILRWLADAPAFLADLVDIDAESDTGVFWHCGLAPPSMADPRAQPQAGIHSNRKMPLVLEFALKPGRVTITRLSQARNRMRLVVGGGAMIEAPKSFSGTSGVIRFDRPAGAVLDTIMAEGLEHHYSIVYGEHRPALRKLGRMLDLEVLELT